MNNDIQRNKRAKGDHCGRTTLYRTSGRIAAYALFILGLAYIIVTAIGLLSLQSPQDPIGDPCFTLMELFILLMLPFLVLMMIALQAYARADAKFNGTVALMFMIIMATITSGVHFSIYLYSRHSGRQVGRAEMYPIQQFLPK